MTVVEVLILYKKPERASTKLLLRYVYFNLYILYYTFSIGFYGIAYMEVKIDQLIVGLFIMFSFLRIWRK